MNLGIVFLDDSTPDAFAVVAFGGAADGDRVRGALPIPIAETPSRLPLRRKRLRKAGRVCYTVEDSPDERFSLSLRNGSETRRIAAQHPRRVIVR